MTTADPIPAPRPRKPATLRALRAQAAEVARLLKILSHRNRLLVACELMEGERGVGEIEAKTGVMQPALSRELARLRAAGLVAARRDSKQIFYRLADRRLAAVVEGLCAACANDPAFRRRPAASIRTVKRRRPS